MDNEIEKEDERERDLYNLGAGPMRAGKKRRLWNEQKRSEQRCKTVNKKFHIIATLKQ